MSVLAVKKLSPAARAKARKEATTTDLRKYAKQFAKKSRQTTTAGDSMTFSTL